MIPPALTYSLFPYTTLFRSVAPRAGRAAADADRLRRPFGADQRPPRSEEHTSELQSRFDLVCRLLLEKKNQEHARVRACSSRCTRQSQSYRESMAADCQRIR